MRHARRARLSPRLLLNRSQSFYFSKLVQLHSVPAICTGACDTLPWSELLALFNIEYPKFVYKWLTSADALLHSRCDYIQEKSYRKTADVETSPFTEWKMFDMHPSPIRSAETVRLRSQFYIILLELTTPSTLSILTASHRIQEGI